MSIIENFHSWFENNRVPLLGSTVLPRIPASRPKGFVFGFTSDKVGVRPRVPTFDDMRFLEEFV